MDTKDIEQLVHRILSKKQILSYGNDLLCLFTPSLDLELEADLIYTEAYESNLYNDYLLEEDLKHFLIATRILPVSYDKNVEQIEKNIEKLKIKLYKEFLESKKRKKNQKQLDSYKKQLAKQQMRFHSFDFLVLENYAQTNRYEFIIKNTLYYHKTDELYFDLNNDIEYIEFSGIIETIANNIISPEQYKEIARSEYWRNYYTNNKHNLLPYSARDYSSEQKTLINISAMYDRIFEHPEAPDQAIMENDDALDGWMLNQHEQNKREKKEKGVNNIITDRMKNSQEIFLMSGDDKEQVQDILDLNDAQGLSKIKARTEIVQDGRTVEENQLPDVQNDLRQKLRELSRKK